MEYSYNSFKISDDKNKINIDTTQRLLHKTYWANNRNKDTIRQSIDNSICYGIYLDENQVGFGRVVTDYATMYWICDIIIDPQYRGQGLGKILMNCITQDERVRGLRGILATKDAHGLYEQYGFTTEQNKFMSKTRK